MCHDGFENLMLYNLNSNLLEDVLTESNSHQGDICLMKSAKKSKSNKSKIKLLHILKLQDLELPVRRGPTWDPCTVHAGPVWDPHSI